MRSCRVPPRPHRAQTGAPKCHCLSASWREGGTATVDDGGSGMTDHNGVLMMQRALLAGTLGLAMARKAAAILEGDPRSAQDDRTPQDDRSKDGAVLRAILDAANECLGHFDDRPAAERWCDTLFHLLDLAAFATELGAMAS